jgi:hypothetical protein
MSYQTTLCTFGIIIAATIFAASCSREPEYTDAQRACIAQRFGKYDAANLSQCVNVCQACMSGTTTTCTTSCKLKGAS